MLKDRPRHNTTQKQHNYPSLRHASKHKAGTRRSRRGLVDSVLGHRYEMKYVISEVKAAAIERFIEPYLNLDYYTELRPERAYPIVSLYLDSANLQLCRESLEGYKNRFKLRVRSYTDDLDYPRFVEIKRRVNSVIIKDRALVMDRDVPTLLSGLSVPSANYKSDEEVLRQFQLYVNSINAAPLVRIRYLRRAYEDDSHYRVRVTFDRQLCYNVSSKPKVSLDGRGWQRCPLDGVIMEIKFTARYPAWLSQMVKYFNLRQRSMSKYVSSIKQSYWLGFCAPRLTV